MKNSNQNNSLFQPKKEKKYERLCNAMFVTGMLIGCTSLINLLLNY